MCLVNYSDVVVFSVNLMNRQSVLSAELKEPDYVKKCTAPTLAPKLQHGSSYKQEILTILSISSIFSTVIGGARLIENFKLPFGVNGSQMVVCLSVTLYQTGNMSKVYHAARPIVAGIGLSPS